MTKGIKELPFSPLMFLASLGAGGIAVIPFAFLQYTFPHGIKGLVTWSAIDHTLLPIAQQIVFYSMEAIMIIFSVIHIVLSIILAKKLHTFVKSSKYANFIKDPLVNAGILAPFISIVMTMNVFIGPIRFFWPAMAENLQMLMLPALVFWAFLWVLMMQMEIKLLKTTFVENFDTEKLTFGWLLHPFALGMLTVTGMGIAAMSTNSSVAHTAAFMSLVSGTMGIFLFFVKLFTLFKAHFVANRLPEKQFLPSFLIVIPSVTLYSLSMFRIGHYLENHHGMHLDAYYLIVITVAFAFETWYLLFGLALLKDYFKKHHFKDEFFVTQWGLICPIVAYAVLGSLVYNVFVQSMLFYVLIILTTITAVVSYFDLGVRNLRCAGKLPKGKINCS